MTYLVCPLNWGLGHASRCIPIIRRLIDEGNRVVIAADGYPMQLLKTTFSELTFIELPSYNINYSKGKTQVWAMLKCLPAILKGIFIEHQTLKKIIAEYGIDTVISDNRFGLWNHHIHCVYITHQLMVKMPSGLKFMEKSVWRLHRFFINKYDECWIPDNEQLKLAGDLAHKYLLPSNARFIGILSRFSIITPSDSMPRYHTAAIVSGPEPQRTIFENELTEKLSALDQDCIIIEGKPQAEISERRINRLRIVSHLNDAEMMQLLIQTPHIICRAGYTSIMDLAFLGKKATFVATPGQTEQEYLATLHS